MNELTEFYIIALKFLLKKKGIKQKDIAEYLKIAPPSFNQFINGKRNFSDSKREEIAKYLETTCLKMLILGKDIKDRKLQKNGETALQIVDNSTIEDGVTISGETGTEISESKKRLLDNIYKMGSEMENDDLKDVLRNAKEKIEKKRMQEQIDRLQETINRKAG